MTKLTKTYKSAIEKAVDANGHPVWTATFSGDDEDRQQERVLQNWDVRGIPIPADVPRTDGANDVVLLADHDQSIWAVLGKVTGLHTIKRSDVNYLRGRIAPLPAGVSAKGDEFLRRMEAGQVPEFSVGFSSNDYDGNGVHRKNSLLEISAVAVPAYAGAVMDRAAELAVRKFVGRAFEDVLVLDDEPVLVPVKRAPAARPKPAGPDFIALQTFVRAVKAGGAVSAANEAQIRQAVESLQAVLRGIDMGKQVDLDSIDYENVLKTLTKADIEEAIQGVVSDAVMMATGRVR